MRSRHADQGPPSIRHGPLGGSFRFSPSSEGTKSMNRTTQRELALVEGGIKRIYHILSVTPDDSPHMPHLLIALGEGHHQRFSLRHEIDDIRTATEYMAIALTLIPDDHPIVPNLLNTLGASHSILFQHFGEMKNIELAIEHTGLALALTPDGDEDLSMRLANLGTSHIHRFERLDELPDLEKAIQYHSRAFELTPNGHPHLATTLTNLGGSLMYRFQRLGALADLEKAIQYGSRAVDLTPEGHPDLPKWLANIGTSHSQRFERLGELVDIEKSIEYLSRAVGLTPEGHPSLSITLTNLARSHKNRFERLDVLADLEKAIQFQSRAVDLTFDGHPHLISRLSGLGVSHIYRFQRLGELTDAEKSIQYLSRALNLTPEDHPDLPSTFGNLGRSHSDRFQRLGALADIEKAIQYQSRAVDLTPECHPDLPNRLDDLGISHDYRYQRLGELPDLEKAINCGCLALNLTPESHPNLSKRLTNLAVSYSNRFLCLGELADLDKAIQYESRAVDLTPESHPEFSSRLVNLGGFHNYRYQRLDDLGDVEKSIQYNCRALSLTPDSHPDIPRRLSNLGASYDDRFCRLGQLGDLSNAIQHLSRSITLAPDGHPPSSLMHLRLAMSNFRYYQQTNSLPHLEHSLQSFRLAAQSPSSAPRDKFQYARRWATLASQHSVLNPIEAYQAAINLLPQFIWLGATTDQRYEDLKTVETLAVDSARAAILSSDYALALEWLEHARCVVWNQNMMLRSPLDNLQSSYPALADRLRTVATQIHSASAESRESRALSSGSMTAEEVAQLHRQLAQEYNDLISKARILPGFDDFLLPIKANCLVHSARYGPVVVINCHQDRCDALIVLPEQDTIKHLPLPNINGVIATGIQSKLRISLGSSRGSAYALERRPWIPTTQADDFGSLLAFVWYAVVKPVLDFLEYTNNVQPGSLPHITWCPTGPMSFLPLHAAGDYSEPQSRVFHYAISSYTPTLTALLESTHSSLSCTSGVLAIGQQATPGHTPLPGTATELASVKVRIGTQVRYSQLMDDQATTIAVLDGMAQHDWVHLACHAHQNVSNATESGFFLHDGTLDLAAINRQLFKGKGLAFLSACQTAQGDEKLPDEAVHLASGMLMAGYTSVIATMWSVVDADAPVVADGVYARLLPEGKLGNGEAGRALHEAVTVLREQVGEEQFERWVPYIHIGS